MADKYPDFETLSESETAGVDYRIVVRRAIAAFAIIAPHGGGIEPGTSEVADAIATDRFSMYSFEGLKSSGNADLHITATRFDEPMCLNVVRNSEIVIAIHGEHTEADGEGVFVGGRDVDLGESIAEKLGDAGFSARPHPNGKLQGKELRNICNRCRSRAGVQLELSRAVRKQMFSSLSAEGRKTTTARFDALVGAVNRALDDAGIYRAPATSNV